MSSLRSDLPLRGQPRYADEGDKSGPPDRPLHAKYEPSDRKDQYSEFCLPTLSSGRGGAGYRSIRVRALERGLGQGRPISASGYHARVLQHEIDHLDGLVYLDRMPDMKSLAYTIKFG